MNRAQKRLSLVLVSTLLSACFAACLGLDHSDGASGTIPAPIAPPGEYILDWTTPDGWGHITVSPSGTPVGVNQMSYPAKTVVTVTATAVSTSFEFGCFVGTDEQTNSAGAPVAQTGINHVTMNSDRVVRACFPVSSTPASGCPEPECNH